MSNTCCYGRGGNGQCAGFHPFMDVRTQHRTTRSPGRRANGDETAYSEANSRSLGEMMLIPISLVDAQWRLLAGTAAAATLVNAVRGIEDGELKSFSYAPPEGTDGWQIALQPFEINGERYAQICDVGDSTSAESTSQLARNAADGERRRLARELHDGAAQYVIGLHLAIARLRTMNVDPAVDAVGRELSDLIDKLSCDLRATTYLRHPPEIENLGLSEAIKLLCEGFSERSHIDYLLRFYGSPFLDSPEVDAAVYRIVQEGLTNVHRHARAGRVHLRVVNKEATTKIFLQDDGIGLNQSVESSSATPGSGVGISGMVSRVRELGGTIVLRNRRSGGVILGAEIPRWPSIWRNSAATVLVDRRAPRVTVHYV